MTLKIILNSGAVMIVDMAPSHFTAQTIEVPFKLFGSSNIGLINELAVLSSN
jgi:hypothetical protein